MKGLFKYNDSRNYWLRYTDETGVRRFLALRTSDEVEAIQRARAFQAEGMIYPGKATPRLLRSKITDVVNAYIKAAQERHAKPMRAITAAQAKGNLSRFIRARELQSPADVSPKNLDAWLADLKSKGKAQDTLFTYARDVCAFSRWLAEEKHVPFDALANYKRPQMKARGRQNWVRRGDFAKAIQNAIDADLRFILYCGFHAGMRKGEICAARVGWFDLNPDKPVVHIQNHPESGFFLKDSDNRTVPLTNEFAEFLRGYLADALSGNYALRPEKTAGKCKYRVEFRRSFTSHMEKCGLSSSVHDMRRSFASNLLTHGATIYDVAYWLGDRVEVVQKSYGYLESYNSNINKLVA
jgi:integrase